MQDFHSESYYRQVSESLKLVFDISSRIDERVKNIAENQNALSERVDKLIEKYENVITRLSVLENKNNNHLKDDVFEMKKTIHDVELKVSTLQTSSVGQENKWKIAIEFFFKLLLLIIGGIIALQGLN